jgi:hypothetical protein
VQLALLALHICREQHIVRLQLSQSSDISAVGCPNNMGEHVNASEDPRDNILGRRRMHKGAQYASGMSPCLLKGISGWLDASVGASILEGLDEISTINRLKLPAPLPHSTVACTNGTTYPVASWIDENADAVLA